MSTISKSVHQRSSSPFSLGKGLLLPSRRSIREIFAPLYKLGGAGEIKSSVNPGFKKHNNKENDQKQTRNEKLVKNILQGEKFKKRSSVHSIPNSLGSKAKEKEKHSSLSKKVSRNKLKEKHGVQFADNKHSKNIAPTAPTSSSIPFPLSKTKVGISEHTKADVTNDNIEKQENMTAPNQAPNDSPVVTENANRSLHLLNYLDTFKSKIRSHSTKRQKIAVQAEEKAVTSTKPSVNPFRSFSKMEKRRESINAILTWKGNANMPEEKVSQLKYLRDKYTPSVVPRSREQEFRSMHRRLKITYFLQEEAFNQGNIIPGKVKRIIQNLNRFEDELMDFLLVEHDHPQASMVLEELRNRRDSLLQKLEQSQPNVDLDGLRGHQQPKKANDVSDRISSSAVRVRKEKEARYFLKRHRTRSKQKIGGVYLSHTQLLMQKRMSRKNIRKGMGRRKGSKKVPLGFNYKDWTPKQNVSEADKVAYKKPKVVETFIKSNTSNKETKETVQKAPKAASSTKMVDKAVSKIASVLMAAPSPPVAQVVINNNSQIDASVVKGKWTKNDFVRLLPHPGEITKNVSKVATDVQSNRSQPLKEDTKPYMSWLEEIMADKLQQDIKLSPETIPIPVKHQQEDKAKSSFGANGPQAKTFNTAKWAKISYKADDPFAMFKYPPDINKNSMTQLEMAYNTMTPTGAFGQNVLNKDSSMLPTYIIPNPYKTSNLRSSRPRHGIPNSDENVSRTVRKMLQNSINNPRNNGKQTTIANQNQQSILEVVKEILKSANMVPTTNETSAQSQIANQIATNVNTLLQPKNMNAYAQDSQMTIGDENAVGEIYSPASKHPRKDLAHKQPLTTVQTKKIKSKRQNILKGASDNVPKENTTSGSKDPNVDVKETLIKEMLTTVDSMYKYHHPFQPGNLLSLINFPQSLGLRIREKEPGASLRMKLPIPNYVQPLEVNPQTAEFVLNQGTT